MNHIFKNFSLLFIHLLLITSIFTTTSLLTTNNNITDIPIIDLPVISTNSNHENLKIINNYIEKYRNNEVIGEISILDTDFVKPIMQHSDNDYYLNHLENKKSHYMGSIYLDFRNNISTDQKLLIYGHNSSNISMPFEILEKYYNKQFFQEHQYIKILTKETTRLYKIFSIYIETNDFDYMQTDFANKTTWLNHLTKLQNKSMYQTDTILTAQDNILILQTCSTHQAYRKYQKKYLLVVAKEVI